VFDDRIQMTEVRKQKSENRCQKTVDREQRAEDREKITPAGCRIRLPPEQHEFDPAGCRCPHIVETPAGGDIASRGF